MGLRAGRKEITAFFYLYMMLTALSLCIDAGVIPPGSPPYPYFVAVQAGLSSAMVTCLLINGFVGFQLYEDGTPLSLWMKKPSRHPEVCAAGAVVPCACAVIGAARHPSNDKPTAQVCRLTTPSPPHDVNGPNGGPSGPTGSTT